MIIFPEEPLKALPVSRIFRERTLVENIIIIFLPQLLFFLAIFLSGGRVDEYRLHTVAANFGLRSLFHNLAFFGHGGLFLRRGAFYGGEKADERVVASYLAAKPPLSPLPTPIMGFFGLRWGREGPWAGFYASAITDKAQICRGWPEEPHRDNPPGCR